MFQRTLSKSANDTLALLGKSGLLDFAYMAGGSALALQIGHRQSVDFDFFSYKDFVLANVVGGLKELGDFEVETESDKTIVGSFRGVKWSLFYYKYPLISDTVDYQGIKLASIEDIGAMKMEALLGRATRKDYIDIYFLMKKFGLDDLLRFYDEKYKAVEGNWFYIVKSLQYFEDAETTNMPVMFEEVNWEAVKETLRQKAKDYWDRWEA